MTVPIVPREDVKRAVEKAVEQAIVNVAAELCMPVEAVYQALHPDYQPQAHEEPPKA